MLFLTPPFLPFSLALGVLVALLALEVIALLAGGSVLGLGEAELDLDPEIAALSEAFDLPTGAVPDLDGLVSAADRLDALSEAPPAAPGGIAAVVGLVETPFMIWLAALLLGFGLSGLAAQSVLATVLGQVLPGWMLAAPALAAGLGFARAFGRGFARLLPRIETTATSAQFLGGLRGIVSQGNARQGMPAEVRLRDRHGNTHYLRCEPFLAQDEIPEGAAVLTVRSRQPSGGWVLRILPID